MKFAELVGTWECAHIKAINAQISKLYVLFTVWTFFTKQRTTFEGIASGSITNNTYMDKYFVQTGQMKSKNKDVILERFFCFQLANIV